MAPRVWPRTAEERRLAESAGDDAPWREWGPYVSGRQWGTVREDYSATGDAWNDFPFDHAHRRAYRWGEDGLGGLCDRFGFLNLAVAVWNGHDDRLKERLFGLTNAEGNHGEDVKEYWWPLDATPTHSYARWLYRYPLASFPYEQLRARNAAAGRSADEVELADTGVLADNRFVDVEVTHAKAAPDDILMTVAVTNQGPDPATVHVVPQLWFRNTWAWGRDDRTPSLALVTPPGRVGGDQQVVIAHHAFLGTYHCAADGAPEVLLCDNETNAVALYGAATNRSPYPKDAIDAAVVRGDRSLLNPAHVGTKAAFHYVLTLASGATQTLRLRLAEGAPRANSFGDDFAVVLDDRRREADEFYAQVIGAHVDEDDRHVARRAFAGLLWGKQLYRYSVRQWLEGDPASPSPPVSRLQREPAGRNTDWRHFELADVMSMPDEWEYPWFASWDLAFHAVALAHIDPAFAKSQLLLICREWAQHPNGQLPAYEWSFSDVNPPVHAWAAWTVYVKDGSWDHAFLVRIMTKLLLNMGWWVNRKDVDGSDLFSGGFLGMDNISLFDRSRDVPAGCRLEQSDATSWVAFKCLGMLRIALELARRDRAWDDVATNCLERFLNIATAIDRFGSQGVSLWDEQDGFFYDALIQPDGHDDPVRVRSLVGLVPLLAVALSPSWVSRELPDFTARRRWLQARRPEVCEPLIVSRDNGSQTLALVDPHRYPVVLRRLFDEAEFLSPYGIRSLSAAYRDEAVFTLGDRQLSIRYVAGMSDTGLYGGNSNWRGPVWFPLNVLLADALRTYANGAGDDLRVELPVGSGRTVSLAEAADDLDRRLVSLFRPGPGGRRPSDPRDKPSGPLWDVHPVFSEHFNGDTGEGIGATHQTGWTALVAHLICGRTPALGDGEEA